MQRIILSVLLVLLLSQQVWAVTPEELIGTGDPAEGLPQQAVDAVGDFDANTEYDFSQGALDLFSDALSKSTSTLKQGLHISALILAAVILCSLFDLSDKASQAAAIAGALTITAACTGNIHAMISLGTTTITSLNDYSVFLLPILSGLMSATGYVSSSAAIYVGAVFFLKLLMTLIAKLLVPLIYVFVALSAAEAAMNTGTLTKLRDFVKWLITASLKTVMYVFTGFLTISGVIAASADGAKLKAAKLALSGAVPLVGGIISDASGTLLAAASVLKSSVGTYGMLAILALCLLPFLKIAIQYLLMKATTAVSGMLGQKCHVTLVENLTQAMGMLLGITGAYALMLLLTVAFCAKAMGG